MITVELRITGKVQGVWYRASAKDAAISMGVSGKVWNEVNGDVGAIVQGEPDEVEEFIQWCSQGPPLARVNEVIRIQIETEDVYASFDFVK